MEVDDINEIENLDEYFDYDTILQRMLDRVPIQIDKREGSICLLYTSSIQLRVEDEKREAAKIKKK